MYYFTVLGEAAVVGIFLSIIVAILFIAAGRSLSATDYGLIFASGALFHVGCEIGGINKWYCGPYFDETRS